jgi:UDP-2,3-diacylglucosamine hydrolase
MQIQLLPGQKVYFASDFHFGSLPASDSLERERKVVRWLSSIEHDAAHIFLVGDLFDFWFEYAKVVPRGFVRFLGKLAELSDKGIPVTVFTGNHDMWMFGYFTEELGIPVHRRPLDVQVNSLLLHIAHGDGLGPGDRQYKVLKRIFENPFLRWCFARLHPNFAFTIAHAWSRGRRNHNGIVDTPFSVPEKEYIWVYCKEQQALKHRDYYVLGHRHIPLDLEIDANSRYINLGEWFHSCTFAVCDGNNIELRKFED